MYVPSYQMYNVLNVYCRQLRQSRVVDEKSSPLHKSLADQIHLSPEGKRHATIEKVSKDIFEKITRFDSLVENKRPGNGLTKSATIDGTAVSQANEKSFVFNVIDKINKKRTTRLSIEDSRSLIQGLEQLAKAAANIKTESST
jgi:hypothetical protein